MAADSQNEPTVIVPIECKLWEIDMKLSAKLARLKLQKMKATKTIPSQAKGGKVARRKWVVPVLCLVLAIGGTWAVLEFFVWHRMPVALVGTWEVQAGPLQGGTFQFLPDGTLTIRSNDGPEMKAHVAVEGKNVLTTTQNPVTLRDETRTSTIQELTQNSLILELERGDVLHLSRKK